MRNGKIYAKNITKAQREWLRVYLSATTFEPMFQEELTAGTMTFAEVANENIDWFERWMHDAHSQVSGNIPE